MEADPGAPGEEERARLALRPIGHALAGGVPDGSDLAVGALVALWEVLEGYGEFLPLACEEADLWAFNCTRVVDALDEGRSEVVPLRLWSVEHRLLDVRRYEFRPEALVGVRVFRIPQLQPGPVYVSEEVGEAVRAAELGGVGFKLLWEGSPSGASAATGAGEDG